MFRLLNPPRWRGSHHWHRVPSLIDVGNKRCRVHRQHCFRQVLNLLTRKLLVWTIPRMLDQRDYGWCVLFRSWRWEDFRCHLVLHFITMPWGEGVMISRDELHRGESSWCPVLEMVVRTWTVAKSAVEVFVLSVQWTARTLVSCSISSCIMYEFKRDIIECQFVVCSGCTCNHVFYVKASSSCSFNSWVDLPTYWIRASWSSAVV